VIDGFASVAARELAVQLGFEEVELIGTGRDGAVTIADVRKAAPPTPDGLADAGATLYRAVRREWQLRPDEHALLIEACRTIDELEAIERALRKASPVVTGSRGQARAHPLLSAAREHRLALRLLLASLGIEDAEADAGRARGDASARSSAGRKLALIRHHAGRHG
jgi:hypothetical protein